MVDHRWNIEKRKYNVIKSQLEKAKNDNDHDKITPLARELALSKKKLDRYLKDRD